MNVLVVNCGSSSQGFSVFSAQRGRPSEVVATGKAHHVATRTRSSAYVEWSVAGEVGRRDAELPTHAAAAEVILALLEEHGVAVDALGHRFVHGGSAFTQTTRIDADSLARLRATVSLAPIHNPNTLSVIEVCTRTLPAVPQYAVFDTAFHAGLPPESFTYALPPALAAKHGFRKYGFHGLSYHTVSRRAAELLRRPLSELRLVICHLGTGGSSVAAVKGGRSLDTSMGYSPLPGLVMSTRCGDIDAEIVVQLVREGYDAERLERLLNAESGLLGLSGLSSDLEEVIAAAEGGDEAAALAYGVYAERLRHFVGAYVWRLGGADALVFTDTVGLRSWRLRERVCAGAEPLGVVLDAEANRLTAGGEAACVSAPSSPIAVLVVPTDEEGAILHEVLAQLGVL